MILLVTSGTRSQVVLSGTICTFSQTDIMRLQHDALLRPRFSRFLLLIFKTFGREAQIYDLASPLFLRSIDVLSHLV